MSSSPAVTPGMLLQCPTAALETLLIWGFFPRAGWFCLVDARRSHISWGWALPWSELASSFLCCELEEDGRAPEWVP